MRYPRCFLCGARGGVKLACKGTKITMRVLEWFTSRRSRDDWKSWWSLLITLPWVLGFGFLFSGARQKAEIAGRQEATLGFVTAYDRANHNQCQYSFMVGGRHFNGRSSSPAETASVGQQVQVYFDSGNPSVNSLEDFASASRRDRSVSLVAMVGVSLVAAVILSAKVSSRKRKGYHA